MLQASQNQPMQWTRDEALRCGQSSRREPLIGIVTRLKNPLMTTSFTLQEEFALGGGFTWRLKESEIRYRGSGKYSQLLNQRIPASDQRIADFIDALTLLDVWSWRNDYDPEDVGFVTMDGSSWRFAIRIDDRECECGGRNAYPAFRNPRQTTTDRGRYAMLLAAMYACFDIETYIHIANHQRQREAQSDG